MRDADRKSETVFFVESSKESLPNSIVYIKQKQPKPTRNEENLLTKENQPV